MGERTTVPSGSCSAAGFGAPPVAACTGDCIGIAAGAGAGGAGCACATTWVPTRARRTDSSPSLISISARLDSSSRSMSFLILRRSMAVLFAWIRNVSCVWSGRGQPRDRGVQRVTVAVGAETADHAHGQVAEEAGVAEGFACVRIGQVDLDERD